MTGDVAITTPPNGGGDFEPHRSPTGSDIVFLRDRNVDNAIFVVHSDGSGLKRLTNTPNRAEFWATWSSDGKEVIFQDGIRDASLWHQINLGGTVSESGGRTVLSSSAGAVPGGRFNQIDEHIGSPPIARARSGSRARAGS